MWIECEFTNGMRSVAGAANVKELRDECSFAFPTNRLYSFSIEKPFYESHFVRDFRKRISKY